MNWRPKDWGEHSFNFTKGSPEARAYYEAGADAMCQPAYDKGKAEGKKELLEELRNQANAWRRNSVNMEVFMDTKEAKKGWFVFIPDEEERK